MNSLFVDIALRQVNYRREQISGDTFLYQHPRGEHRTLVALSDGLGHGVKANILSTLTATMLLNCVRAGESIPSIGEMILKTLPVCSVRKISYATFTLVDVNHETHQVHIVEHDNPPCLLFRDNRAVSLQWESTQIQNDQERPKTIRTTTFIAQQGDRLLLTSDGITQSGQGSVNAAFGWGSERVSVFVEETLHAKPSMEGGELASRIMQQAISNDNQQTNDDMTCGVIHLRPVRKMLLISCPPSSREQYKELADQIRSFEGYKAICGYPVAEIVAQQLDVPIQRDEVLKNSGLPPRWQIPGIDLVTEGIFTLNKLGELLDHHTLLPGIDSPAHQLFHELLSSDHILITIGTKRNLTESIYLTDEFILRRKVLKRIASMLEQKFHKKVTVHYL